ncbi:vancomycin high temperature exclusion protein [Prolixibacter sp. NT017]|uniref:SanA/YdcF family protein n=1 Tax=Prolixibacter sp. NT017 TaxID=2652390 RepID=UPI001E2ABCC0|nr:ElyC/SanA/YdcF family protein [Prolixibacter sp. NT017]
MMRRWWRKKLSKWIVGSILTGFVLLLTGYLIVSVYSRPYLYQSLTEIPENKCGLVLGTSKYVSEGTENLFYRYRIEAAVRLYKSKKVRYLIVSGDNRYRNYNEPVTMQKDLVEAGVPADRIYLDYAGFRTFDSVIRCREIFGQQKFTIISQPFHNERAVFIARLKGIDAIGYNAREVSGIPAWKVHLREAGARIRGYFDLLFGTQPHFLGKKITIPE